MMMVVVKSGSVRPAYISRSFPSGITTLQKISVKEKSLRGIVPSILCALVCGAHSAHSHREMGKVYSLLLLFGEASRGVSLQGRGSPCSDSWEGLKGCGKPIPGPDPGTGKPWFTINTDQVCFPYPNPPTLCPPPYPVSFCLTQLGLPGVWAQERARMPISQGSRRFPVCVERFWCLWSWEVGEGGRSCF